MRKEVVYLIVVFVAVAAVAAYSGIPQYRDTGTSKPPSVETSPPPPPQTNATSEEIPPFFPSSLLVYPEETKSPSIPPPTSVTTTTPTPTSISTLTPTLTTTLTPTPTPTPTPAPTSTTTTTTTEALNTTTTTATATTTEASTPPMAPLEGPVWRKNRSWEGSGARNTELFTVTSPTWRVNWTAKEWRREGVFYLVLYGDGGSGAQLIVQHQGSGTDTCLLNTTGSYYLKIQSNEFWRIDVEEEASNGTLPETPIPAGYREVLSWSGVSGNYTKRSTEKFEVSNSTWRITWTTKGNGALQVRVYDEGGRWFDMATSIGSGDGLSHIYGGPGEFSLLIESVNIEWKVAAEEPM